MASSGDTAFNTTGSRLPRQLSRPSTRPSTRQAATATASLTATPCPGATRSRGSYFGYRSWKRHRLLHRRRPFHDVRPERGRFRFIQRPLQDPARPADGGGVSAHPRGDGAMTERLPRYGAEDAEPAASPPGRPPSLFRPVRGTGRLPVSPVSGDIGTDVAFVARICILCALDDEGDKKIYDRV